MEMRTVENTHDAGGYTGVGGLSGLPAWTRMFDVGLLVG